MNKLVIIKGGGDLATGIAHRLFRCGLDIVVTEISRPTVIRRSVAFANAIYESEITVEGVTAVFAQLAEIPALLQERKIPVVIDPQCIIRHSLSPWGLVDAVMAKRNTGTSMQDAKIVIGVGPGFTAGQDVHRVVETMRGHDLGRVILEGTTAANTGVPGEIGGYTLERLITAPNAGKFRAVKKIGDVVKAAEILCYVGEAPVCATIDGVLRGILHDGLMVAKNMKIGDIDPRIQDVNCWSISDKARAIGGGVLEALLMSESCFQVPSV